MDISEHGEEALKLSLCCSDRKELDAKFLGVSLSFLGLKVYSLEERLAGYTTAIYTVVVNCQHCPLGMRLLEADEAVSAIQLAIILIGDQRDRVDLAELFKVASYISLHGCADYASHEDSSVSLSCRQAFGSRSHANLRLIKMSRFLNYTGES